MGAAAETLLSQALAYRVGVCHRRRPGVSGMRKPLAVAVHSARRTAIIMRGRWLLQHDSSDARGLANSLAQRNGGGNAIHSGNFRRSLARQWTEHGAASVARCDFYASLFDQLLADRNLGVASGRFTCNRLTKPGDTVGCRAYGHRGRGDCLLSRPATVSIRHRRSVKRRSAVASGPEPPRDTHPLGEPGRRFSALFAALAVSAQNASLSESSITRGSYVSTTWPNCA